MAHLPALVSNEKLKKK